MRAKEVAVTKVITLEIDNPRTRKGYWAEVWWSSGYTSYRLTAELNEWRCTCASGSGAESGSQQQVIAHDYWWGLRKPLCLCRVDVFLLHYCGKTSFQPIDIGQYGRYGTFRTSRVNAGADVMNRQGSGSPEQPVASKEDNESETDC